MRESEFELYYGELYINRYNAETLFSFADSQREEYRIKEVFVENTSTEISRILYSSYSKRAISDFRCFLHGISFAVVSLQLQNKLMKGDI